LEIAHQRLVDRLNRIVQSSDGGKFLQESFITQRQGRYVIPLRAEFKGRIQGVVHDQSASGATLFVEPLVTVDLNNRWRQLQLDEEQEVRRVLLALSQQVSGEAERIQWTVEALADLDLALAKAKYADDLSAAEPQWIVTVASGDTSEAEEKSTAPSRLPFTLLDARHPLLDPGAVMPIEVVLAPETFIVVITGPNTGGKTVTLKTIGLLVAMAQAGLHIPAAEGSTLPFFRSIYADIGDEQSIEQSLSTFSAHMTNIVNILAECDHDSLVVLDELGAGTDPVEGSALARAILEYLNERGVTTFVATHFSELKAYAHHTPGVVNASVEFDEETLAPTYRLMIGLPGRSNAFAIARRLGIDPHITDVAQAMIAPEARQTEAMLQDIQKQLEAATQDQVAASAARTQAEARSEELAQRLTGIDRERRDILNTARAEARQEIEAVRQELLQLRHQWSDQLPLPADAAPPEESKEEIELVLDSFKQRMADEVPAPSPPRPTYRGPLQPGDQVWVEPLQAHGEVISSHRGQVEVQLGRFRTSVRRNQVELRERKESDSSPDETVAEESGKAVSVSIGLPIIESPGMELDLRGQTTEEGLHRLDLYLDNAYLAELPWVRIIHGKGSGVLRAAVRQALNNHPLVSSYRAGEDGEGGDGVTVVKLAVG
jgi:DNA mismatch repair protein MutS2